VENSLLKRLWTGRKREYNMMMMIMTIISCKTVAIMYSRM